MRNAYLNACLPRFEAASIKARRVFGGLSETQLNWKPAPKTWSVAQCLDHLVTSNSLYFPALKAIERKQPPPGNFWTRLPLFHGFWAKTIRSFVDPDNAKKVKTVKPFEPAQSGIGKEILEVFDRNCAEVTALIRATAEADHLHIVILSPAASFISYSLKDLVEILAMHAERHVNQAECLLRHAAFPR